MKQQAKKTLAADAQVRAAEISARIIGRTVDHLKFQGQFVPMVQ